MTGASDNPREAPVISATHTVMDGLVVRWRCTTEGPALVSASRNGVMIHGDVVFDDVIEAWITQARTARDHLVAGRREEAKVMATHEYDRPFFGDLVPIKKG